MYRVATGRYIKRVMAQMSGYIGELRFRKAEEMIRIRKRSGANMLEVVYDSRFKTKGVRMEKDHEKKKR